MFKLRSFETLRLTVVGWFEVYVLSSRCYVPRYDGGSGASNRWARIHVVRAVHAASAVPGADERRYRWQGMFWDASTVLNEKQTNRRRVCLCECVRTL